MMSVNAPSSAAALLGGTAFQHDRGEVGRLDAHDAAGGPVPGLVQRDVGPDALERRLQHLRVAGAHPGEQLGDLGVDVRARHEVHLEDGHAATLVIVEEPAKGPGGR